jgi:SAM-dependent methyltransferase
MQERLTPEEWGKHYNPALLDGVVQAIREKRHSAQTAEMLKLTLPRERILEIGCGSGATSLALACEGRVCTAIDNSTEVVALVTAAAVRLQCPCEVLLADAAQELPFEDNAFDVSFQAGLLEHFHQEERIQLLTLWGRVSRRMVSLIPNAASLAYRLGKARMEKKGTWTYGLEMPQYSLAQDFTAAGFDVAGEYTIGEEHALRFLPRWHPLRLILKKVYASSLLADNAGQGYLLVTVGEKRGSC